MAESKTINTDPSVKETDMYTKGEPRGSVPLSVTNSKPQAYQPPKSGPK